MNWQKTVNANCVEKAWKGWQWNEPGSCAQFSWHLPYSWGKPQKTSARRPSDEGAVRPVIASNGAPFLQMRSVGSHSTSGWEKEGIKERMGWNEAHCKIYSLMSVLRKATVLHSVIPLLNLLHLLYELIMMWWRIQDWTFISWDPVPQ